MDDFDFLRSRIQSPVILAASVDIELHVHGLVFEHQERREWRHHIHRFAKCDDRVFVGGGSVGDKPVDFKTCPGSRKVVSLRGDICYRQLSSEGLSIQRAGYGDGLEWFCLQRQTGDGDDFLAVCDCLESCR